MLFRQVRHSGYTYRERDIHDTAVLIVTHDNFIMSTRIHKLYRQIPKSYTVILMDCRARKDHCDNLILRYYNKIL